MSSATGNARPAEPDGRPAGPPDAAALAQLGMWLFLATELLFFGGLMVAYLYGRSHLGAGFAEASRHTDVLLGTLNTGLLLSSSALVALAVESADAAAPRPAGRLLLVAAALGIGFLVVKGIEYRSEWHEGLFPGPHFALAAIPGAELFFMLYFVTTAVHALHLTIGIALLATLGWGARRERRWAPARRIEVAGLYWHFVDIVWIFLYPLLYLVSRHGG